jgi:hypothetical protein
MTWSFSTRSLVALVARENTSIDGGEVRPCGAIDCGFVLRRRVAVVAACEASVEFSLLAVIALGAAIAGQDDVGLVRAFVPLDVRAERCACRVRQRNGPSLRRRLHGEPDERTLRNLRSRQLVRAS